MHVSYQGFLFPASCMEIACRQPHHSELVCLAGLPRRLARRAGTHQGSPRAPPRHSPLGGRLGRCPGCALGCPGGALGHPQGTPKAPPGQFDNQRHESVTNSAVLQEGRRNLGVTTAGPRKRGPVEVEAPSTNSTTRDTNL